MYGPAHLHRPYHDRPVALLDDLHRRWQLSGELYRGLPAICLDLTATDLRSTAAPNIVYPKALACYCAGTSIHQHTAVYLDNLAEYIVRVGRSQEQHRSDDLFGRSFSA